MKKNIYKIIAILLLVSVASGCDDFLEENPTSFINPATFFKTERDAEAAVISGYNRIGAFRVGTYGWWRDWVMEITTDDFDTRPAATANNSRNVGLYTAFDPSSSLASSAYSSFSSSINTFNVAIDGINGMEDFTQKTALVAEARFLRGYTYFTLVRLWGRVPLFETALSGEEALSLPRSNNIDEVYDLIIKDLEAGSALPETQALTGRATKWAAMSLLSKVHLTLGNWSQAAQLAKDVIAQSPHELLPVYGDVFRDDNENNIESIFEIQMMLGDERSNQVANWPRGIGPVGSDDFFLGPNWGGIYIATDDFVNDFETGDDRRNLVASSVTRSDGTVIGFNADGVTPNYSIKRTPKAYIEGIESNNNSSYNFIYLRLADIYLVVAEAENEDNGPSAALTYINEVRKRAGLSNIEIANPTVASDQSEFRNAVRKERRTELFDERNRIFDLLRWGTLVDRVKASRPDASIQSHHTLWPLPIEVFDRNPGLKGDQNPGYTE